MGAFFAGGVFTETLDVVPGHQGKRAGFEAGGHVAAFRHEFVSPTGAELGGEQSEAGVVHVGHVTAEPPDHRFEIVVGIAEIGEAAVALGVAIDFAGGVIRAGTGTEAEFFIHMNGVAEVQIDIVALALGITVGGAAEQVLREISLSKSP